MKSTGWQEDIMYMVYLYVFEIQNVQQRQDNDDACFVFETYNESITLIVNVCAISILTVHLKKYLQHQRTKDGMLLHCYYIYSLLIIHPLGMSFEVEYG